MDVPFEDFEYLARSEHRVRVLRELAAGPCDRTELAEATGASRATLGRILGSFEDRGWVSRSGATYETTAVGDLVAADVDNLFGTLDAARTLGDILRYLPTNEMDIDLRAFADATVVRPTETDTGASMRYYIDRLESASRLRALLYSVDIMGIEAIYDRVTDEIEFESEAVLSPSAVETVRSVDQMNMMLADAVRAGHMVYRSQDEFCHDFAVVDDRVVFFLVNDRGLHGLVESQNDVVREWATECYAAHRRNAERLDADALASPTE